MDLELNGKVAIVSGASKGLGRACSEALPHLRAQGGGRIINILASTVYTPIPNLALSAATRMGVIGFMKNLSDDVGHENILINNVCPGSRKALEANTDSALTPDLIARHIQNRERLYCLGFSVLISWSGI